MRDLKRFIRFNTVSSRGNALFAAEIGRMLKLRGFRVTFQKERINGKVYVNVLGAKGQGSEPLLLAAHTDTVPPGELQKWSRTNGNPWKAVYFNGDVYGLGSADDKGSLLAMIHAGGGLNANNLKRPLIIAATFGEENGMNGAKSLIKQWSGPKPLSAVVGEPTNLETIYRHKGLGVVIIEIDTHIGASRISAQDTARHLFKGKACHSSEPSLGENALEKALEKLRHERGARPGTLLGNIRGGVASNIIPDHAELTLIKKCGTSRLAGALSPVFPAEALLVPWDIVQNILRNLKNTKDPCFKPSVITSNFGIAAIHQKTLSLTFDFRLLPNQHIGTIATQILRELTKQLGAVPNIDFRMTVKHDIPPLGLKINDPWALTLKSILKSQRLPGTLTAKPACTEAGLYAAWGVPAVVIGPGEAAGNIHAPNESLELDRLEKAVELYRAVITSVLGEHVRRIS